MATFTGTGGNDVANRLTSTLTGFTGGDVTQLIDTVGDTFDALDGNDTIVGGIGDDTVSGGLGSNLLDGGDGVDTNVYTFYDDPVHWSMVTAAVTFFTSGGIFNGSETAANFENAVMGGGNDSITGNTSDNVITAGGGNDTIEGGLGNDTLDGGEGVDNINGGEGFDVLIGGAGTDALTGGNSDDVLTGGAAADTLDGGSGFDVIRYDASPNAVTVHLVWGMGFGNDAEGDRYTSIEGVVGSAYADLFVGTDAGHIFSGEDNSDVIWNGNGADLNWGGSGGDTLIGGGGNDSLNGGSDSDYVIGGDGDDVIVGGEGDFRDYLFSNFGNDVLYGGEASDLFDLRFDLKANDYDTLVDFEDTQSGAVINDLIVLPAPFRDFAVIWDAGNGITQIAIPLVGGNYMVNITGTSVSNVIDQIFWG